MGYEEEEYDTYRRPNESEPKELLKGFHYYIVCFLKQYNKMCVVSIFWRTGASVIFYSVWDYFLEILGLI
jgi:hypothetical protein